MFPRRSLRVLLPLPRRVQAGQLHRGLLRRGQGQEEPLLGLRMRQGALEAGGLPQSGQAVVDQARGGGRGGGCGEARSGACRSNLKNMLVTT